MSERYESREARLVERITKLEQQMIELQRGIDQLQQAMLGLVIFLSKVEAAEGNENGHRRAAAG